MNISEALMSCEKYQKLQHLISHNQDNPSNMFLTPFNKILRHNKVLNFPPEKLSSYHFFLFGRYHLNQERIESSSFPPTSTLLFHEKETKDSFEI